jgi:hypothetical protein
VDRDGIDSPRACLRGRGLVTHGCAGIRERDKPHALWNTHHPGNVYPDAPGLGKLRGHRAILEHVYLRSGRERGLSPHAYPDANANPNSNPDSDSHPNSISNCNAHPNAHSYPDPDRSNAHPHADGHTGTHIRRCDTDAYADLCRDDAHAHGGAHEHAADSDPCTRGDPDARAGGHGSAGVHPRTPVGHGDGRDRGP